MKNFWILIFIFFGSSLVLNAQDYKLNIELAANNYNQACGRVNFLKIHVQYENGNIDNVLNDPVSESYSINRKLKEISFNVRNPIVKIITEDRRQTSVVTCDKNHITYKKEYDVTLGCHYQFVDDPFRRLGGDWLSFRVSPQIKITQPVNTTFARACVTKGYQLNATPNFEPKEKVYIWQFLDNINPESTVTAGYRRMIDSYNESFQEFLNCHVTNPSGCLEKKEAWERAQEAWENYEPKYDYKFIWKSIGVDKIPNPQISLRDIYSKDKDFNESVGKPIDIRIKTLCGDVISGYSIIYLPDPPSEAGPPDIIQPSCSYTDDAGVKLYFDRQIYNSEEMYMNLTIKGNGTSFPPIGYDITNSFEKITDTNYAYTWPVSKGKLTAGDYRLEVTGYQRGTKNATCEMKTINFTIKPPNKINFSVSKKQDETCFNEKDGQIEITISGGSESYEYILNGNNWNNATRFTIAQSPLILNNIAPTTYNIQVRDSKGCYDKETIADPNKIETITIQAKQPIKHTITSNTANPIHPGATGLADGSIVISSVSGGTLKNDRTGRYLEYVVLLNSAIINTISGKAYTKGFRIDGLIAGYHKIRYTDANNCSVTLDLPEIIDPQNITYTLTKQDPSCADATDGSLTVSNIRGGYPNYAIRWTRNGLPVPGNLFSINGGDAAYTLSITDQRYGNIIQNNIRFDNVPMPITFTQRITAIECNGSTAQVTINAVGGIPTYQYGVVKGINTTWYDNNTINLPASTGAGYRFRVRERNNTGCDSNTSDYVRILQPTEINIDTKTVIPNYIFRENKGSIALNIGGGSKPYKINWSKTEDRSYVATGSTISGLTAGNYTPTITDATGVCTIVGDAIFVDQPDQLLVSIDQMTDAILCHGQTGGLIAKVTGGSQKYTYTWFIEGREIDREKNAILQDIVLGAYSVRVSDGYTEVSDAISFSEPALLQFTASGTDVFCYNGTSGTIKLNPKGGTRPYTFSIDDKQSFISETTLTNQTIENLREGTYEIWIKDANGCQMETPQIVVIDQPTEIIIEKESWRDVTVLGMNDGNIDISIIGGNGSYAITWTRATDASFISTNEDISSLYAGTYTVTVVDENQCEVARSFEVRQPLPMVAAISLENPIICHADELGELMVNVTGGFPIESSPKDFTYQWFRIKDTLETAINTDFTLSKMSNLAAGWYKIIATDAKGTVAEEMIEITQPDDLTVALDGIPTPVLCHSEATGSINTIVNGGPKDEATGNYLPYTYQWTKIEDPDFTATTKDIIDLTAGTYNLMVFDDNLCTVTLQNIVIEQPDAPLEITNVAFENLSGYQTKNGRISIAVIGGTMPYTYLWTDSDDPIFTSFNKDIDSLKKGSYQLVVTDANKCTISIEQIITEPDKLLIAINPITLAESVQCNGSTTILPLTTTTTGGSGTYRYQWHEQNDVLKILFTSASTDRIPAGTYTVVVKDENGNTNADTYTIKEPDALAITEQVTDLLCNNDTDGSINTIVTGGVPPYRYQWSTGANSKAISGLRAGAYTLTVMDANECMLTKIINVRQPNSLFANIVRTYPSINGATDGNITINMNGGTPPFTFQWSVIDGTLFSETKNVLSNTGAGKYAVTIVDANKCTLIIDDVDLFEPPALEVMIQQVNVISCFGNAATGSLTAVVAGGVPFNANKQYNYKWFDTATGLEVGRDVATLQNIGAGDYSVTVRDAVSTSMTSEIFTLNEPTPLVLTLNANFINCGDQEDWEILSTIVGGTPPYQYRWNTTNRTPNLENQIAGMYQLQITDQRGCTTLDKITLVAPAALEASHTVTTPTCYEGCDAQIFLEVQGGTPPYQYKWSDNSTQKELQNVCAGTYTVIITDAKGCQIQETASIKNPKQLVVSLGEDSTLCKDQSIILDASIADSNATYRWTSNNGFKSNIATPEVSETATYIVLVTDSNGCTATDAINIEATTRTIYTNFIANSQVFVGETFVIVDISEPNPDTLEWVFPLEAAVTFQNTDYAELAFDRPGEYEITIQTSFGLCTEAHSKKILVVEREWGEVEDLNTIEEEKMQFAIYPNPTKNGKFTIDAEMPNVQAISIKVYGIANNALLDTKKGSKKEVYEFKYNLRHLPSGVYFILFETLSGSQVRKLIIE